MKTAEAQPVSPPIAAPSSRPAIGRVVAYAILFVFAAFALTGLAQEFWRGAAARRSLAGGSFPAALVGVVSRNRRRYGGYIVHIGIAVLLIGVAASSSFQTNREVVLRPGESAVIDGRKVTYVKPTVAADAEKFTFGGVVRVEEDGKLVATLHPSRRYFRPTGQAGGTIGSFFSGEATSEVGLRAGFLNDLWIAMQPDIAGVQQRVRAADKGFKACVAGAPGTPSQCDALAATITALEIPLDNPR
jgi:cytochrome c-type biogenesis protein CcmF